MTTLHFSNYRNIRTGVVHRVNSDSPSTACGINVMTSRMIEVPKDVTCANCKASAAQDEYPGGR